MIEYLQQRHSDEEVFANMHPLLAQWFREKFKTFTEPQKYAILSIQRGENTLVTAPTGTGKTLSAFAAVLSELIALSEQNMLENNVYCIYISPLKALNNDVNRNLLEPLHEIRAMAEKQKKKIDVRIAVRTGDTTPAERQRMLKNVPHILITTPESCAILLNSPRFRANMEKAKWIIVDEIHSLAENKRGVHLSLTLERLQENNPKICRIGLSATISPIEEIAKFLVGMKNEKECRDCKIVDAKFLKKLDLKVISPLPDLVNVSQSEISEALYSLLDKLIQEHKTTLVFTNTRSATERVVHHLKEKFPGRYEGLIGAHHSSMSRELRLHTEERLKKGELKVVVSSTSLELGIDIGFIDLVALLGSPKSIARALQRIGRSGHKLHDTIKGRIIVLDRDDLVECSVLAKNAIEKRLDRIAIPKNCLDVLAQQIYGIAIEAVRKEDEVFELVRKSYCFSELKRTDFQEVLSYLSGEYSSLESRSVYAKIWWDRKEKTIGRRGKLARVLYMTNIGTIPEEARVKVKLGAFQIGTIDEIFLERLRKRDVFVLGGQSYMFSHSIGMTAFVKSAEKRPPTVPSWFSEMLPLSFDLAMEINKFRQLVQQKLAAEKPKKEMLEFLNSYLYVDKNAASAIFEYFREQHLYSKIPHSGLLLVEVFREQERTHAIFHSLFGRRVNDALSKAYGYALGKLLHQDIELAYNDNGFILTSSGKMPIQKAISLIKSTEFEKVLEKAIEDTEILKRRFRHCAGRALMILRSYKGHEKSVGRQALNARLLLAAVKRISNEFVVLREARREVLRDYMDLENARKIVEWIEREKLLLKILESESPSPFAFNLYAEGYSDILRAEGKQAFIQRMHEKVMKKITARALQK